MKPRIPKRDPEGAYVRHATAGRRVGRGRSCAVCGERRPEALIRRSRPTLCSECKRKQEGKATTDDHHVAGKANHPLTIPIPVNDHRAELSPAQDDWPKAMRENPEGSPVLAAAASIQGFVDTVIYLIKKGVLWVVNLLHALDAHLAEHLGPKWWVNTPLAQFAPKSP